MFLSDFSNWLDNVIDNILPNCVWFLIGLLGSVIIYLIVFFVLYLIANKKHNITKYKAKEDIIIDSDYLKIIEDKQILFDDLYTSANIQEKTYGLGLLVLEMFDEIATLYHKDAEEPMFEISVEQFVQFLDYASKRLNYSIDELLENEFSAIDKLTKYSLKDKKISELISLIGNKKENTYPQLETPQKGTNFFEKLKNVAIDITKKAAMKYGENVANKQYHELIETFGNDINKLYSGQELDFLDISYREERKEQYFAKKMKRGKNNV